MDRILARDCIPANAVWCTSPATPAPAVPECPPGAYCPGATPATKFSFPSAQPWWLHAWDATFQHASQFLLFVAVWAVVLLLIRAVWRRGSS